VRTFFDRAASFAANDRPVTKDQHHREQRTVAMPSVDGRGRFDLPHFAMAPQQYGMNNA
jgi:hypothetical protein